MATWTFRETTEDHLQTLTASKKWFLDGSNYIVLDRTTTVVSTSAAEYAGVEMWLVDRNTAQTLLNNNGVGSFSGWRMHDPSLGSSVHDLTLPAGQYFIFGYYSGALSQGQTVHAYADVSYVSAAGLSQVGSFAMSVNGEPGSWRAQQFTVTGAPEIYVKAESGAGAFVIMTDAQYQVFRSNSAGYVAGTPPHVLDGGFGAPTSNMEGEFDLAPGTYWLLWYNNSGDWNGGGAYIKAYGSGAGAITGTGNVGTPGGGTGGGGGGSGSNLIPGTVGNDQLAGTGNGDQVTSGAGNDTVTAGAGGDTITDTSGSNYLRGDDGDDVINGGTGFDDINGNMGNDTASGGGGDDWVVGGKDQDRLSGGDGADIVYGNLGNDTCDGGIGNDWVRGGQGMDVLAGGAGNDFMAGDRDTDTLTGGGGADIFHFFAEAGFDYVTDFSRADGDRVQLLPGTNYVARQAGADVVVELGDGRLVLMGVQMSSLTPGWIFS